MKITHGRPCADEGVLGVRRAVHEVPRPERSLLPFDQHQALPGEDEEVLLIRLAVVPPADLPRLEHGQREADVGNDTSSPSKMQQAPSASFVTHAASRMLTTNQPSVTAVRPGSQLLHPRLLAISLLSPRRFRPTRSRKM
jgi:hypothetical protein